MRNLPDNWRLLDRVGDSYLPAQVPGSVHGALVRAEKLPSPYLGREELEQQWVAERNWTFECHFDLTGQEWEGLRKQLHFPGIDTVASVELNGEQIAQVDNAFRHWVFDVECLLKRKGNRLRIHFAPPRPEMTRRYEACRKDLGPRSPYGFDHFALDRKFLRKPASHAGWDWGPCLLTPALTAPVALHCFRGAAFDGLTLRQKHLDDGTVELMVKAHLDRAPEPDARLEINLEAGYQCIEESRGPDFLHKTLLVESPELWWPRGSGPQKLYTLEASLWQAGAVQKIRRNVGFRKIEWHTEADPPGSQFHLTINGQLVFCRGANWIPLDALPGEVGSTSVREYVAQAAEANFNMLRVWGGGTYEQDAFYEACDEMGLLVWQDFMFACMIYPADDAFLKSVRAEVRDQVRRLQGHACLALWCGANEIQGWIGLEEQLPIYEKLILDAVGATLQEEDPDAFFWPSSPSSGVRAYEASREDPTAGDVHWWDSWFGGAPPEAVLTTRPRFVTEYGFQSYPSYELLTQFMSADDCYAGSPALAFRQRSQGGDEKLANRLAEWFPEAERFEDRIYQTQLLQMIYVRACSEHWRRQMPYTMGSLYWQFNDVWPGPSWSSVEYGGRWKLLHYAARQFFSPVAVSIVKTETAVEVWLVNDTPSACEGSVSVESISLSGLEEHAAEGTCRVEPFQPLRALSIPKETFPCDKDVYLLTARFAGESHGCEVHEWLGDIKNSICSARGIRLLDYSDARGMESVTLVSEHPSAFVYLAGGVGAEPWEENGFHLWPGKPRKMQRKSLSTGTASALRVHAFQSP